MREILEKLWSECFSDECVRIESEEERMLTKRILELYEKTTILFNKEQEEAMEKYVDALYDAEAVFLKKAFFKGCEFACAFLLETGGFK